MCACFLQRLLWHTNPVTFTHPGLPLFSSSRSVDALKSQSGQSVSSSLHSHSVNNSVSHSLLCKWAPAKWVLYVNELFSFKGNVLAEGHNNMHYSKRSFIDYAEQVPIHLCVCVYCMFVCVWEHLSTSHLGLDDIKRSMEATRHCCLATATIPPVFCCYGTAVQISL